MHDRMYIHTCTHTYIARHFSFILAQRTRQWLYSTGVSQIFLPGCLLTSAFEMQSHSSTQTTAALRLCLHTCCRASQTRWPTSCKTMEEFHKRLKYFRSFSMSFSCFSCPISITPSPKWTPVPSDFLWELNQGGTITMTYISQNLQSYKRTGRTALFQQRIRQLLLVRRKMGKRRPCKILTTPKLMLPLGCIQSHIPIDTIRKLLLRDWRFG